MDVLGTEGRRADQVLALLATLANVTDGGEPTGVDELTHACQAATRAERDGADAEVVLAMLLHDLGKVVGDDNHSEVSAAVLAPHVRPEVAEAVRHHPVFTQVHWGNVPEGAPDPREAYRDQPWFDLCARMTDEWDLTSFDPDYDTLPLEHFEPLVKRLVTGA
jgi:predicted HD phosphohydrolase